MIPILVGVVSMSVTGWASRAYITDSFRISLRRGPSIENKILKFLPSGLPVDVLESSEGWSRIIPINSDEDDISGWVLSRYLITRRPWEDQAKSLMQGVGPIKQQFDASEKALEEAKLRERELKEKLKEYKALHEKLQNDFMTLEKGSGDFLTLKTANEDAQKRVNTLTLENENLKNSQMNRWFALGALVLLCGLMIGLLIGRQQKKRQSSRYY